MAECWILSTAVPDRPGDPNTPYRVETRCETHGMLMPYTPTELPNQGSPPRCPIGLIEDATDAALARIARAGEG